MTHAPPRAAFRVATLCASLVLAASCADAERTMRLRVRLENVSDTAGYLVGAEPKETGLSPGLVVFVDEPSTLYRLGAVDPGLGLEALAEQGAPFVLFDELAARGYAVTLFELADVTYAEGGIHPGESYTVEVHVEPGSRMHLATMFGESNDWLVATPEVGLDLAGLSVGDVRDVSSELVVVDVGTEASEPPFTGPNQGPRQATADAGVETNEPTNLVSDVAVVPASRAARLVVERLE